MTGDGEIRTEIVDTARRMIASGLTSGTSGNISARGCDGMLITPSAMEYERMTADDIVALSLDGEKSGGGKPSSEWRMHAAIYKRRPEAGAVLHAHPPFATALAVHGLGIPAFHYMVAVAGGADIRCAGYATFGSAALADLMMTALEGRRACLLAHHGMICFAATPSAALALGLEVETLAAQYWRARQLGTPPLLGGDEMARVVEKFSTYRRRDGEEGA